MRSARQQGGVAGGGDNGRADAASCFLGPELQAESWADVAWECATVDSGVIGGSMGGGRQQGEVVRGGGAGGTGVASCFPGPEVRSGSRADVGLPATETRHLCGSVGTGQLGTDGGKFVGSTEGGRQQGEVVLIVIDSSLPSRHVHAASSSSTANAPQQQQQRQPEQHDPS